MTTNPQTLCRTCMTPIGFIDCPTGGWWAHETHPADEHDAVPGAWVDGDELMEAIAAEVWEHCEASDSGIVVDDPRNIAGTAAAVARRMLTVSSPPAADRAALRARIAAAVDEGFRLAAELEDANLGDSITDSVLAVLPPSVSRADAYRDAADAVAAHPGPIPYRPQLDEDGGFWWDTRDRDAVVDLLRRMADEARQQKPEPPCCSDPTCACVQVNADGLCECVKWDEAQQQPDTETLPPPEGPEYMPCACGHIEPEHGADSGVCLTCGCEGYRPCTCGVAGDAFVPLGHYADCPQAAAPAVVAQPGKETS